MNQIYNESQKLWQLIRRGRHVEFNLMYDLGTKFGLSSGGNTENILMSLPPQVSWQYQHQPLPGSPEDELLQVIKNPIDWI
jgi:coproporphyrinogen III oxidase